MRTALVPVLLALGAGCGSPAPEESRPTSTQEPEEPALALQDQLAWLKSARAALAQRVGELERDAARAADRHRLAVRAHELATYDNGGDRNGAEGRRKQVEELLNQRAALIEKTREEIRHLREHRLAEYDRLTVEGDERLAAGRSDLLVYPAAIASDYRVAVAQRWSDLDAPIRKQRK
ncbi:hypothetical protein J8F10_10270 [Gemmata sp. G18]|uniref:OmpH family outer membrane protein n=1 Tax=Gemmata palustris TaxID=2822762 RepID=A0ABS5BPS4_9BACT|nr:hypothetical protein [Gemmata palustris]MBP3955665.1 hypothetical protein [Gemmata palustris]